MRHIADVFSDAWGIFTVDELDEGTYDMVFSKDGYNSQTLYGIEVIAGRLTKGIEVSLVPTARFGAVSGYVFKGEKVLPGATIRLLTTTSKDIGYETTTDDNGFFIIDNINPGIYLLEISTPDGKKSFSMVEIIAGGESSVVVTSA